jgi:hypothetical protein
VVPRDAILRSRAVQRSVVSVPAGEIATAPIYGTAPRVAPGRDSVLVGGGRAGAPPSRVAERGVVARTAPPPPPVPFEARQRNLEAAQGRPLDAGTLDELRQRNPGRGPAVRTMAPARSAMPVQAPAPSAVPVPAMPEASRGGARRATPSDRPATQSLPVQPQRQEAPRVDVTRPARVEGRPAAPATAPVRDARPPRSEGRPASPPARVETPRSERPRQTNPESRAGRRGDRPAAQKEDKAGRGGTEK